MGAYFRISRAQKDSVHVPRVGEVFMRHVHADHFETVVGDGKTPAKDLPALMPLSFEDRLWSLERAVRELVALVKEAK